MAYLQWGFVMCGCSDDRNGGCDFPARGVICVPRGDAMRVVVDVRENTCDGELFDISSLSEIVFAVYDENGGANRIEKRLSTGGVTISTNDYQFYFTVTNAESASVVNQTSYFEITAFTASGLQKTILCGTFKSPETSNKDL